MPKKIIIFALLGLYIYVIALNIFLNPTVRFPAPLLFGIPLIALFGSFGNRFLYHRELLFILLANLFVYVIDNSDYTTIISNAINILTCAFFFNYFVGTDSKRFNSSIIIFFGVLALSTVVMLLNHMFPAQIVGLRSTLLMGGEIFQSPSGISAFVFSFGYQLAAIVSFIFIYVLVRSKSWLVKASVLLFCLLGVYFGMQRSAVLVFIVVVFLFSIVKFKFKASMLLSFIGILSFAVYSFILKDNLSTYDNVFSKNERNSGENRGNLVVENLEIIMDYPYGLLFHGKKWQEVVRDNPVFASGITSHNAYLMFITIVGPFIGIFILIGLYGKYFKIFISALRNINDDKYTLLVCLCFAFLGVSMNALFHNAWLGTANGPTVFLYFAIIRLSENMHLNSLQDD